ncbi:MAG TPA: ribbon-helix-helix domain-containing protein [Xanthobacteraceae bacterium]|jgi:predicted DNA-binding ribbon-helix-helix protein|nr:ribbon-helix-helix domain-containing protein [Xanthobacteraceae bacterium]
MTHPSSTKYSITIAGQKTSISLEAEFWDALDELVEANTTTRSKFIRDVARNPSSPNLTSSIRVEILRQFRKKSRTLMETKP